MTVKEKIKQLLKDLHGCDTHACVAVDSAYDKILQLFNDEVIGENEYEKFEDVGQFRYGGGYKVYERNVRNHLRDQLREKLMGKEEK